MTMPDTNPMENLEKPVVLVDARRWPLPPSRRLAGLPIFLRTLLTLERAGAGRLQVSGGAHQATLEALLSHRAPGIPVAFVSGEPDPADGLVVEACALYEPGKLRDALAGVCPISGARWCALESAADLSRASGLLWRSLRKPIENDGVIAYFLGRPVSRLVSRLIIGTPITPNQVTILSGLSALAGAFLLTRSLVLGAALYWFSFVLDCVDGELARLRFQGSRTGQWLDTIADDTATVAFSAGLSVVMLPVSTAAAVAGFIAAGVYALSCIPVYRALRHLPTIDTAQYPYFFMGEKGAAAEEKNLWTILAYGFRRDVILFLHLIFSLIPCLWCMFALQFVINAGMAFITWLDVTVKALRRA